MSWAREVGVLHATKVAGSLPPHIAAPLHACGSLHPSTMLSFTICVRVVEKPQRVCEGTDLEPVRGLPGGSAGASGPECLHIAGVGHKDKQVSCGPK